MKGNLSRKRLRTVRREWSCGLTDAQGRIASKYRKRVLDRGHQCFLGLLVTQSHSRVYLGQVVRIACGICRTSECRRSWQEKNQDEQRTKDGYPAQDTAMGAFCCTTGISPLTGGYRAKYGYAGGSTENLSKNLNRGNLLLTKDKGWVTCVG